MEGRTRVAANAASVIPFSCIICFDEFTKDTRPPMVLPCGHTFVCLPCSKRLKRCMECREPLFLSQAPKSQTQTPQRYSRGRYGSSSGSPLQPPLTPPHPSMASSPPAQVPLPIPKNVVLLAMMEAAERQNQTEPEQDEEEEDQFDLNRIITGMATASGPTGTYIVRESTGLAVVLGDPRAAEEKKQEEPVALEEGQRVQVVDFEDGVARLAREQGYIVANTSQLVKVGLAKDQSCNLEGLLNTVACRGRDLQRELDENHKMEENLRAQLQIALDSEPTYPIVTEPPKPDHIFREENASFGPSTPDSHVSSQTNSISQPVLQTPDNNGTTDFLLDRVHTVGGDLDANENSIPPFRGLVPGSPCSIDNADINHATLPRYRRSNSNENIAAMGCGASFLGETSHLFGGSYLDDDEDDDSDAREGPAVIARTNSVVESSPTQLAYGTPTQTSSFDLDFRTGLSGHRALQTSKQRRAMPRRQVRFMGEHRGISRIRPIARNSPPSPSGWTDMIPLSWQQHTG